jgi:hypothetical protein
MSGQGDSSYEDSPSETPSAADNNHGTTLMHSAGAEFADEPPAEPMSREEFADYMRQGSAADTGDENTTGSADGPGGGYEISSSDPAGEAQGMTRAEYADYMRQGSAAGEDDSDDYGTGGIDQPGDTGYDSRWGDPAEEAQGMTRGEYADYMQQGPAAGDDDLGIVSAGDHNDPSGDPDTATTDLPAPAQNDSPEQASPDQGARKNDNPYTSVSVVELTPADRTLGDTTPTGIGLKPTGEQLIGMEDDTQSRLEKLRRNIYERADDMSDAADEHGGTLGNLFEHPPTESHTEVPSSPQDVPSHQGHAVDGGHLASAALVVGLLGFELFRTVKNRVGA